jgi:hypothetical protein
MLFSIAKVTKAAQRSQSDRSLPAVITVRCAYCDPLLLQTIHFEDLAAGMQQQDYLFV